MGVSGTSSSGQVSVPTKEELYKDAGIDPENFPGVSSALGREGTGISSTSSVGLGDSSTQGAQGDIDNLREGIQRQQMAIIEGILSGQIDPEAGQAVLDQLKESVDVLDDVRDAAADVQREAIENEIEKAQQALDTMHTAIESGTELSKQIGKEAAHILSSVQELASSVKSMKQKDDGTSGGGGGGGMMGGG